MRQALFFTITRKIKVRNVSGAAKLLLSNILVD